MRKEKANVTEKDPCELKKIREAMRGNLQAYGDLVTSHQDYLYRIAYLYTRDEQMALDAVGSSILKGFTAIRKLKDPAFFMTWLTRIQINAALDECRKRSREIPTEVLPEISLPKESVSAEEKMDLRDAVNRLPETLKKVVVLKYYLEMTIPEIAYLTEMPEGTVKAYLSRARKELQADL